MTPSARLAAAIAILTELDGTNQPVERMLLHWGRTNRYAGSKDRAAIAERVYDALRHRSAYAFRMGAGARASVIASLLAEGAPVEALFSGEGYGPAALTDEERARLDAPPTGEPPLSVAGEFPPFLEEELRRAFGDGLLAEMLALQTRAPIDLRANTLKTTREDLLAALNADGFDAAPTPYAPHGIRVPPGAKGLERIGAFAAGHFEFQDEASQLAALLCGVRPGQRVLDLAAGAGGKTLALAAAMENRGEIVATDECPERLAPLAERAARAGARIIRSPERAEGMFDVVLVDAPCSGTGTWRRQPELRWRLTPERIAALIRTQDGLLDVGARPVRPGGRLVYVTCSLLPAENEDRIADFLARHADFAVLPAGDVLRDTAATSPPQIGRLFRASPRSTGTDGFFTAVLQKAR